MNFANTVKIVLSLKLKHKKSTYKPLKKRFNKVNPPILTSISQKRLIINQNFY